MKRKKVLWLIKGLGLGGAERLLQRSLAYTDSERYEYEVAYFLPWKDALVADLEVQGIKVHALNQARPYSPFGWLRLVRLLRRIKPDILHMHLPYAAVSGRTASRFAPVGTSIYTEHNVFQRYNRAMSLLHSRTYRMNDGVIFVSDAVGDSVKKRNLLGSRMLHRVIPNGVDTNVVEQFIGTGSEVKTELGIPAENRIVVTVASLTPKKRHVDLLTAAQTVLKDWPDTTFVLIGGGPLEQELKQSITRMGLESNVVMTGAREDALRLVSAADLFVLPSENEGLPISILEAMTLGIPVLATKVGGVPDVVDDDKDGLLVDPYKPDRLAVSISRVFSDPSLGRRLSEAAREKVYDRFTLERMVKETEAFYEEVMASKGLSQ